MLTTIEQFAGKDIWVYAELDYEDAYIRVEKVFEDGTVWYNAWLPSDSLGKYDIDEILYGELTGDVDSIEIHPLDTITTDELIAKIKADGKISGCSKVTSSRKFTKYPSNYVKASENSNIETVSDTEYSVLVYRCHDDDIRVFHDFEGAKHYADWQVKTKNTALARICIGDDYGNPIYEKMDKDN